MLGGSYLIEYLTKQIEEKAWEYIKKIDDLGGASKAIEVGFQKNEIEQNAYQTQLDIENKKIIEVGVNEFTTEHDEEHIVFKVDDNVRKKQIEKLKTLRKKRDNAKVNSILETIKLKAMTDENLLSFILEAVENYATVGEISNSLREVWGEYKAF